ncbi:MAG: hypothetical protein JO033_21750 [Acidobacteriaceae bacterium]|nr:hypothetical protein [Acidobacteriaceae bacterium]MBV9502971.1 hypothetical protein [Acidobacteriaceae bacterium]
MFSLRPLLIVLALPIISVGSGQQNTFVPACGTPLYPSPPPSTTLAIDSVCGLQGDGGPEAQQNRAKNNFCASGDLQLLTGKDFQKLQEQVDADPSIPFGDKDSGTRPKGPAQDRGPLQKLGEGKLVSLQGYVLSAKQEGAESVNCQNTVPDKPAYHDIHIELVDKASETDECAGIVAEMIPHHRPANWRVDNVQQLAKSHTEVRVTGQLFFDSSHFPCKNGQAVGENPKRISLWEIHPIYKIDVCSGDCTGTGQWIPLDQWLKKKKSAARPAATSLQ